MCGYVVTGFLFYSARQYTTNLEFALHEYRLVIATWSLSIAIQMSASLLITWKIWSTTRVLRLHSHSKVMSVMWIVLESEMVLSFTTVMLLVFYALNGEATTGVINAILGQLDVCAYYTVLSLI